MSQLDDNEIAVLLRKALRHLDAGDITEASETARLIEGVDPGSPALVKELATLYYRLGWYGQARRYLDALSKNSPDNESVMLLRAQVELASGNGETGEAVLRRLIEQNTSRPDVYANLGGYLYSIGSYHEAIELLKHAVSLKPSNHSPYRDLVLALRLLQQHEEALKYAEKLVRLKPNEDHYVVLAGTLVEMGRFPEAEKQLLKSIQKNSGYGLAYYNLANIKSFKDVNDSLIAKMKKALKKNLSAQNKALIYFALGKAMDDCRQYDEAFGYYKNANLLVKSPSEPNAQKDYFRKCKKHFNKKLVSRGDELGCHSRQPVFIVGMPRSGTTLLETMLSRHPSVRAAGELMAITRLSQSHMDEAERGGKAAMEQSALSAQLHKMSSMYLANLREMGGDEERVVDKMPGNFLNLGLIHLLFPKATIINIHRHPLDTCLSCYFQSFSGVEMSFDLDWIANYYQFYRDVLSHWQSVLPAGRLITVNYEDVIGDTERCLQDIVNAMGLEWADSVLEQKDDARSVVTASYTQVRKSVYATSINRWKNYVHHIAPLVHKLDKFISEEDRRYCEKAGVASRSGIRRLLGV